MKVQAYEIHVYETTGGDKPYSNWINALRDLEARARIDQRLNRLKIGNFGDYKLLQNAYGVYELRFTFSPGYRIYFGIEDEVIVLLLCGGDKSSQEKDIRKAIAYWNEYTQRRIQ